MSRVVCFGELLIRLSSPGHALLAQAPALELHVGGAEANVAVALACLGRPARMFYDRAGSAFAAAAPDAFAWDHALEGAGRVHLSGVTAAIGAGPARAALHAARVDTPEKALRDRGGCPERRRGPDRRGRCLCRGRARRAALTASARLSA